MPNALRVFGLCAAKVPIFQKKLANQSLFGLAADPHRISLINI